MAAINFTTLKNTDQETIIKFQGGSGDTGTITIANLTSSTQARNSDTPTVNIVRWAATGLLTSGLLVTRNSVPVIQAAPENAPFADLSAFSGISDSVNNTYDIAFSITSAAVTGYIVLRKIKGWSLKVETAAFGIYDNTSVVGS
jgi:hypothetical protein